MAATYSIEHCTKMIREATDYAAETGEFQPLYHWINELEEAIREAKDIF